ncbi:Methyl-CpG-binding domain-containing protein 5 [Bienertia sinuspersici]
MQIIFLLVFSFPIWAAANFLNQPDLHPKQYYLELATQRRFRSKKEVLYYLETGSTKKRKNADSDADTTPTTESAAGKKKKSEGKAKKSLKNFNFDDVPAKVKWVLSDIYEGTWRPLMNGADRVAESAKQEWTAAFTFLTLQNDGGIAEFF